MDVFFHEDARKDYLRYYYGRLTFAGKNSGLEKIFAGNTERVTFRLSPKRAVPDDHSSPTVSILLSGKEPVVMPEEAKRAAPKN